VERRRKLEDVGGVEGGFDEGSGTLGSGDGDGDGDGEVDESGETGGTLGS
jgi:hypothetical protein